MAQCYLVVLLTLSLTSALLYQVSGTLTDPFDVTFLNNLYRELNYPQQLVGWNSGGGDPCEVSWKGTSCNGSSVIFIQLNGLQLSGRLGDQLFNLVHLKQPNVSSIHIYGEIPASLLPPNATYIDLSFNDFSENIPYSLMSMKYLRHLNFRHDSLSGPVGNVFPSLQNLKRMDLSNNNFTGDLSTSFQDLKNLTALQMDELNLSGCPRDQLFNQIQKQLDLSINAEDLLTSSEHQQQPEEHQQQLQDGGDDNANKQQENWGDGNSGDSDEQQENGGDDNSGDGDKQQGGEGGDDDVQGGDGGNDDDEQQGGEGGNDDEQQGGESGDDNVQRGEEGDNDEQGGEEGEDDEQGGEEGDDDEQQGGEGGDDNANSWCPRDWSKVYADSRGVQCRERQRQYHLRRKGL